MRNIPKYWIGKSGTKYPYKEYVNWGDGIGTRGMKDLPKEDYPYGIEFYEEQTPKWKQ